MVSAYGYTTVAELEAAAIRDYSVTSTLYIDSAIEASISQSERQINVYCHTTFAGTIPDGVKAVTLILAERRMHNIMLRDGHLREGTLRLRTTINEGDELDKLLKEYIKTDLESDAIDVIPMNRNQRY